MKRLPLGRIAVLMMIIFCNKQAIGAAVPFQQLNANLTNQSLPPQEQIFRRHLLNVTDTNITHTNSTGACTSYNCIADKYYLNWVYGAVGAVALFYGIKYFCRYWHREDLARIRRELEADPPMPEMEYFPDGVPGPVEEPPGEGSNAQGGMVHLHLSPPEKLQAQNFRPPSFPAKAMQKNLSPKDVQERLPNSDPLIPRDFETDLENPTLHLHMAAPIPQPTRPAPVLPKITRASTGALPTSLEKTPKQGQRYVVP